MSPQRWWESSPPRRPPPPGGHSAPDSARRGSRGFSTTWWGQAWVEALEQRAQLDPNRLPRGRTYARQGYVLSIELARGSIRASVAGSRSTPYAVQIDVRTFTDAEWDQVIDAIGARAAHAAALLDGELEPGVVDDVRRVGIELLPGPGDLHPRCSCPDQADPCKHAAAVCYLVAPELDGDPFQLFELRGRSRAEVLDSVRSRRRGASLASRGPEPAADAPTDAGVVAREAWSAYQDRATSSSSPTAVFARSAPVRPGAPAPWPTDPPRELAVDAAALRALAADAAHRAWGMVRQGSTSGLELDATADLARRAALALGTPGWDRFVDRAGRSARELAALAVAWQHGRDVGVAVLDEPVWTPPAEQIEAARAALASWGVAARSIRVTQNRLTVSPWRAQLRLASDGRWWGFTKEANRYQLVTAGHDDVDDAIEALTAAVG